MRHSISTARLESLDALYEERTIQTWTDLVEELRQIRRAIQVGAVVVVAGETLYDFQTFYEWACGRYPLLEEDTNTGSIASDQKQPYG